MRIVLIIIAVLIAAGVVSYFLLKKKGLIDLVANRVKAQKVDVATVDGECRFDDCMIWFKELKLNKDTDIPFIMDYTKNKEMFAGGEFNTPITKPSAVMLGVLKEKGGEMSHIQIIQCDKLDDKLVEVLHSSKDGLIVLD